MEGDYRVANGSGSARRGTSLGTVLRCARWLALSSLLAACTPPSTVKPPAEPAPPDKPMVEPPPPQEEDEGWKAITG